MFNIKQEIKCWLTSYSTGIYVEERAVYFLFRTKIFLWDVDILRMAFMLFIRGGKSFTEQHKNAKKSGKKEASESSE